MQPRQDATDAAPCASDSVFDPFDRGATHMNDDTARTTRRTFLRSGATIMVVALMTGPYLRPNGTGILDRLQLTELGEVVAVDGGNDLSYSGAVDGEVWTIRPPEGAAGGGKLAENIGYRLVAAGCEAHSMLSGHPGDNETIVAQQWDCEDADAELGWRSDRTDVDLVVSRATGLHG